MFKNINCLQFIPGVCNGYFNSTSGALNPGVPARGAAWVGLIKHKEQILGFPKHKHVSVVYILSEA